MNRSVKKVKHKVADGSSRETCGTYGGRRGVACFFIKYDTYGDQNDRCKVFECVAGGSSR